MRFEAGSAAIRTVVLTCFISFVASASIAGAFHPDPDVIHFGRVFDVEAYDFDRDGWIDLLVSDYVHGQGVLYGRTDRTFDELKPLDVPIYTRESGHGAALGDLNGDGNVDVFLVYNRFPERVLLSDDAGRLVDTGQEISAGSLSGTTVSVIDRDGDGDLDAFATYYQHGVELYLNDGTGRFVLSGEALGADFISVTPGDIDEDSDVDLVGRVDASTLVIVESVDGAYSRREELDAPGCRGVFLFDADGDSWIDLLIAGDEGSGVWLGDGTGAFSRTEQAFNSASKAAIADVNGDGDQDLAIGSSIWLNDGAGTFTPAQSFAVETLTAVALLDLDGDERPELILGSIDLESGSGPLAIYWNEGN